MLCTCLQFMFLLGGPTIDFSVCELSPADVNVSVASQFINEQPVQNVAVALLWNDCLTRAHTHTPLIPDPDVCNKDGITPLQIAACCLPQGSDAAMKADGASDGRPTSHQVIQMLLEADGKSVRERLVVGKFDIGTPLQMASSRDHMTAVQELLKHIQSMFTLPMCG